MAYGLPVFGEDDQTTIDKFNNSIEYVKAVAEAAQSAAAGNVTSVQAASQAADQALERAESAHAFIEEPTDARVAELVADTASSTGAALSAAYAKPNLNTIIPLGDSITDNGDTAYDATAQGLGWLTGTSARGYWAWASVRLGHRLDVLYNAGVSNETAAQIAARVQADVIDRNPGWCVVEAGRNSVSAPTSAPAADLIATLTGIYDDLLGAGIRVVATTITPKDSDTTAEKATLYAVNAWMKEYVRSRRGMVLADFHGAVADPATGAWRSGYSYDGLHPGALGAAKLGEELTRVLDPLVPAADLLVTSNADPTNLLTNGMCVGTAGTLGTGVTGQVADGWRVDGSGTITATASKVTRTDGRGEWQQMAVTANEWDARFRQTITTGVAVGDTVYAMLEFETDSGLNPGRKFEFGFYAVGSPNPASVFDLASTTDTQGAGSRIESGVFRTPAFTIPAGMTGGLYVYFRMEGTGTVRLGRATLRKV